MTNHSSNSRYIILTLTIATLLAFFAMQAGATYTTVTTPITGTVSTSASSPDIQILVSSDGNTLSSGGDGIYAGSDGSVSIDKMSGGPDSLVINSGSSGVNVAGGTVSSDADLVINSGGDGVYNSGGTVNLAGVSIDAASAADIAGVKTTGSGNTTISGDKASIKATTTGSGTKAYAVSNEGSGAVSINTGDAGVELTAKAASGDAAAIGGTGAVSIITQGQASFDVTGFTAKGLYKEGSSNVTVDAAGGSSYKVTSTSGDAYGLAANGNTTLAYGKVNSVTVNATGGDAYGLAATNGGTLSGDGANSISNLSVTENTAGKKAYGAYAASGGSVKFTGARNLNVSADNGVGYGISASNGSVSGDAQSLTVNGNSYANGIDANGNYGDVRLALSGDLAVNSASGGADGVTAGDNGSVQFTGVRNLTVSADNGEGCGIWASEGGSVSGDAQSLTVNANSYAYGVRADNDGDVRLALSGDLAVNSASGDAVGVSAVDNNSSVKFTGARNLTVSADNGVGYGISASNGSVSGDAQSLTVTSANGSAFGIEVGPNTVSTINISKDLTVRSAHGGTGITATGAAHQITVGGLTDVSIAVDARKVIYAADGANVNLNGGVSLDVTGTGDVSGIKAANGGNVTVSGDKAIVKASTTGENLKAYAVSNTGSGAVSIDTGAGGVELIVSAASGDAAAVNNTGTGRIRISTSGQISYDITAQSAQGMYNTTSLGSGVTVSAAKGSNYIVTATSGGATGIEANGAALDYGQVNNVVVSATGGEAYGLEATNGGKLNGDAAYKMQTLSVSSDKNAYGIYTDGTNSSVSDARVGQLTVNSGGNASGILVTPYDSVSADVDSMSVIGAGKAYGIENYYSTVKLAMSGDMDVRSTGDIAIGAASNGTNGNVSFSGVKSLNVSSDTNLAYGIYAGYGGKLNGSLGNMNVYGGSGAYGILANMSNVDLAMSGDLNVRGSGANVNGVVAEQNAAVTFTGVKDMTVSADGTGAAAYGVNNNTYGSNSTVSGDMQSLTVTSAHGAAYGIDVSSDKVSSIDIANGLTVTGVTGGAGVIAMGGAAHQITVGGLTDVSIAASGDNAIYAAGGSNVNLNGGASLDVTGDSDVSGIKAETGGSVTISGDKAIVKATTTGYNTNAYAISNTGTGAVSIDTGAGGVELIVSAVSGDAAAVSNSGTGSVTVKTKGQASFDVTGHTAQGLYKYGSSSQNITVDAAEGSNYKVTATSGDAYGIAVNYPGATFEYGKVNNVVVSATSGDAYGLAARTGSTISGDGKNSIKNVSVTENTAGKTAYGVYASNDSRVTGVSIDKLTVNSTGAGIAVSATDNSNADLAVAGDVIVTSAGSQAAGVRANNSVVSVDFGSLAVSSSGDATGLYASSDSRVNFNSTGSVSVSGENGNAVGIKTDDKSAVSADLGSLSVTADKGAASGIDIESGNISSVDITNDLTVFGAEGGAGITAKGTAHTVTVGGLTDVSIAASGDYGVYAAYGANVNLKGGASLDVNGTGQVLGIYAENGNITVGGSKAIVKSALDDKPGLAIAVANFGSGAVSIDVTGDIELTASAQNGYAAAVSGSNVTLKAGGQASFDVTALEAKGLYKDGSSQNLTVDAKGGSNYKVTATSGDAYGIAVSGDTTLAYGKVNNVNVTATKGDAYGLAVINGGVLSGDAKSAIKNITVTENTAGKTAYGILVSDDSTVNAASIDVISVSSAGTGYGVLVNDSSKLTAKIGAITVNASDDAYGLYAPSSESTLDVSISGPVKVTTEKGKAIGVYSASGGVTVSDDQAVITATSKTGDASAITPDSGDITVKETSGVDLTAKTDEGTATGVDVSTGKTVDVTTGGAVSADVSGAFAYGFKAEKKGNTTADSLIDIATSKYITVKATATSGDAAGFYASGDIAKITYKADGALNISADATNGNAYGFRAENGGVISGDSVGGTVAVKSTGGSAYGVNADNSTANVGIQNMSVYSASSNAGGVFANSGDVTLAMSGDMAVNSAGSNVHSVAYGVHALAGGSVKFTGVRNLNVSADNGVGNGLYASNGSVSGDAQSLTVNSKSSAFGVGAVYSGDVNLALNGDLTVNSESGDAYGVDAEDSGSVKFTGVRNLNVSADNGVGYGLYSVYSGSVSGDAQSLTVTSASGQAYGIDISSDKVSTINIAKDLTVKGADGGAGITAQGAAHQITVGGLTDVSIAAGGNNGVYAADSSNVNLTGGVSLDVTGTGDVSGIRAENGGKITVSGDKAIVKASTTGVGAKAYALNNTGSGDITINNTGDVELTASSVNGDAQAIGNSSTGKIAVNTSGQVSFDVTGLTAKGLFNTTSQGTGVTVSADKGSNYAITATSGDAYGIAVSGDNTLAYGKVNNVTVTATKGDAYGLLANNGGTLSGDTASPIKSLTVTANTDGHNAYGILASGGNSQADFGAVDKLTVTATGVSGDAYGVYAQNNGSVRGTVSGDLKVTAAQGNAYGIYAPNEESSADITVKGAVVVSSDSGEATGVYAAGGGVKLSGPEAVVKATSGANSDAVALYPKSNDITISENGDVTLTATSGSGGAAYGARVPDSRRLDLATEKSVSIDVTGGTNGAYGLYAESGTGSSDITATAAKGAIRISAKATNGGSAYGLVTSGDGANISLSANTISVDAAGGAIKADGGNVTVSADSRGSLAATGSNAAVIYAANGVSIDLTNIDAAAGTSGMLVIGSGDSTISAKNSVLSGDIKHSDVTPSRNVMTLNLLKDTTFTGKANSPRIDVNIDDTSTWEVTGDSNTYGTLKSTGTVKFVNESRYSTVTTDKLSGKGGVYLMHADLENDTSDKIVSAKSGNDDGSKTTGTIGILNEPNSEATAYRARMTGDLITVTGDKNSSFKLLNNDGYYEYGAWKYVLASEEIGGSGLGWYLLNTGKASNTVTAVFNSLMAPNIGHLEEGALYSQLGDPAYDAVSGDRETHVWGYAVYNKSKYTGHVEAPLAGAIADDNYAENKFYGLTGGMDKIVHESDNGTLRLGAMMGYGEGDLDMNEGDASDNSFHAGVYGVYKWTNGLYLAGVAKYNRYRTDVTARPTEGGAYEASYNQDGFGISALAGKRFDLKNSWYVEPQAELGLARIGSASYTINNSDVEIDSTNSVRGRLGFSLGRRVATETGKTLDFYVKASVIREFDGETDLTMSGDPFKADFGGTWGQYKLGINYWNNDNFMLHGALVYENGENYESPIGIELGLNWFTGPKPQKDEAEAAAEVTE